MKAAQINAYGDTSVIKVNNDAEKPKPSADQVLIQVYASSLNPFDTLVREGYLKEMVPLHFPATLGGDIAGIVVEVGTDVTDFKVGDKVYGQANVVGGNSGAFAEFAAVKAGLIAKMPKHVSFKDAASLALTGVSALQALTSPDHINLQPGQKVLIQGGSGGIGSLAIQIAKHIGAYVAATAPTELVDYVKQLGADEVIDYKTQDFEKLVKDYDAVFDTVGGEVFHKSFHVLKPGGIVVSMAAQPDKEHADKHGIKAIGQNTKVVTAALNKLSKLIEDKVITPHIYKTFPFDDIQEAFKVREAGGYLGKISIIIKKEN